MNLNHWHRLACLTFLLPVLAASGCTNSDVLTPTTGLVNLEVDVNNVPVDFRFDTARFRILQIIVQPVDPDASAVLGTNHFGMLHNYISVNYNIVEPLAASLSLASGTYRLEQITIHTINFRDPDAPPDPEPPDVTCAEYIDNYRSDEVPLTNFGREILIDVNSGEENIVRVTFDWGVFTEAMQTAWACYQVDCPETWCLSDFDAGFSEATFNNFVPDFLSVD